MGCARSGIAKEMKACAERWRIAKSGHSLAYGWERDCLRLEVAVLDEGWFIPTCCTSWRITKNTRLSFAPIQNPERSFTSLVCPENNREQPTCLTICTENRWSDLVSVTGPWSSICGLPRDMVLSRCVRPLLQGISFSSLTKATTFLSWCTT